MGMSTHVVAFRDMDGEFARMLKIKQFCDENKVSYPSEVEDYFKGSAQESEQVLREEFLTIDIENAVTGWEDEGAEGYEVDIIKLPKDVKIVRFYNSY